MSEITHCQNCQQPIPEARRKALPGARTCIDCSQTGRKAGFPIISGKTSYSELQLVDQELAQELYAKQDRKGGSIANGVQFRQLPPPKTSNFE